MMAGANSLPKRPPWLRKKIVLSDCRETKKILADTGIATICQQALCPNIGECFRQKQATFLILGTVCTRGCLFCAVQKGRPVTPDEEEPDRVARAVVQLGLAHVVITSVTRDDLPDGGASWFATTAAAVRAARAECTIELLIPDCQANPAALAVLANCRADVVGHNVETVPRLYADVRSGAEYGQSLMVLRMLKEINPRLRTKSGIMVGMGETREEVVSVMRDLRGVQCDFLSIGQYLSPGDAHYPVQEYIHPDEFDRLRDEGHAMGFRYVVSGPYVRSSYAAGQYIKERTVP